MMCDSAGRHSSRPEFKKTCDFIWYGLRSSRFYVNKYPVRPGLRFDFTTRGCDLIRTPRTDPVCIRNPGTDYQLVSYKRRSKILNVVRSDDPCCAQCNRRRRTPDGVRMGGRGVLHPADIFNVVHVAVTVHCRLPNRYVVFECVDRTSTTSLVGTVGLQESTNSYPANDRLPGNSVKGKRQPLASRNCNNGAPAYLRKVTYERR